jgi:UDP-3-O-[3-hydroxymyristoyl] glucosamine N-acyltransferase
MGYQLKNPCRVSELAMVLDVVWRGADISISHISPFDSVDEGALCFARDLVTDKLVCGAVLIAPAGTDPGRGAVIEASNSRLTFARALIALESSPGFKTMGGAPVLGEGTLISPTAVLGNGVRIGARSVVGHNVVIADGVRIGEDCVIKSNSVIGEAGFGFERDEAGLPIRILHLGSVIVGDRVEIGSLNTVCRGTLGDTILEDDVKTDDHVHIAHNCRVGRAALITACVELSGGVDIGEFAWIGPNSSILQKVKVGARSFVGIASNVTKFVPDGLTVAGNPARVLQSKK